MTDELRPELPAEPPAPVSTGLGGPGWGIREQAARPPQPWEAVPPAATPPPPPPPPPPVAGYAPAPPAPWRPSGAPQAGAASGASAPLTARQLVAVVLATLVVVAGMGVFFLRPHGQPASLAAASPADQATPDGASSPPPAADATPAAGAARAPAHAPAAPTVAPPSKALASEDTLTRQLLLRAGDLPPGWMSIADPFVDSTPSAQPSDCFPTIPAFTHTTIVGLSQFSYKLQRNGREDGHLTSNVIVYASPVDGQQTFAAVSTPADIPCLRRAEIADLQSAGARGISVTVTAGTEQHDVATLVQHVVIAFSDAAGTHTLTKNIYRLAKGRVQVRLSIQHCGCATANAADEAGIVQTQIRLLVAAAAQAADSPA